MDISPYRRAYFALVKSFGLGADARHEFNRALTRKPSTKDWSVDDWRLVVAELQRRAGQHVAPGRPRIRGAHPERPRASGGVERAAFISAAQLEYIAFLAAAISWRVAPEAFIRARLLNQFRKSAWDGKLESLTRREAASVVTAFKRMAAFTAKDAKGAKNETEVAR